VEIVLKHTIFASPKNHQHISSFRAGHSMNDCNNASLFPDLHVTTHTKNVLHQSYKPVYHLKLHQ